MATEKLIVELDAKTQKLDSSLDATTKKLDDLEDATNKTDSSLSNLSSSAQFGAQFIAGFGAAAVTAGAALSTMVVMAGKGQMELEQLARQAKLSTEEFEALSFATRQYGVDGEQIADISKDIADKLGEFAKVGTGPFQDIADVIGITKEGAQDLAIEFENMTSEQVIGELINRMEQAGASTNEMTFALESMGNDLSKLLPLFANNGEALATLKGQYNAAAGSIKLTREEAEKLKESATAFDLLTDSLGKASDKLLSKIAGPLTSFFNDLNSIIPLVTQDLVDFINTFVSAGELTEIVDLQNQIIISEQRLAEIRGNKPRSSAGIDDWKQRIEEEQARLQALKDQIKSIEDQNNTLTASSGGAESSSKFEKIIEENDLEKELKAQQAQDLLDIEHKANNESVKSAEKASRERDRIARQEARSARDYQRSKERAARDGLRAASQINSALLDDNKAIGAGIIVADTAIGVQKALAQQGAFGFASAAAIAASGIAQLANLESAAKGGGSISGSGAPAASDLEPDLNTSTISAADASGSSSEVVVRFEGGGDEITDAIAKNLLQRKQDGAIS